MSLSMTDNDDVPVVAPDAPDDARPLLRSYDPYSFPAPKPPSPSPARSSSSSSSSSSSLTPLQGYSLMLCAAFLQAIRAFLFHVAGAILAFPPVSSLLISAIVYLLLSTVHIVRADLQTPLQQSLDRNTLLYLSIRGFCAALSVYLNNIALAYLPVGTVLTLFATIPAITSILAAIFLRDPLSLTDFLLLALNFLGVLLVANPNQDDLATQHPQALTGVCAVLLSALSASTGFLFVNHIGTRVHFIAHLLSISIFCFLLSLCSLTFSFLFSSSSSSSSSYTALSAFWDNKLASLLAMVAAIFGFLLKALVNRALQVCRPGPALVVRALNVPLSFALGVACLHETAPPDASLGVVLVLASVTYTGLAQLFRETPPCATLSLLDAPHATP